jgi:hypothetical protein
VLLEKGLHRDGMTFLVVGAIILGVVFVRYAIDRKRDRRPKRTDLWAQSPDAPEPRGTGDRRFSHESIDRS